MFEPAYTADVERVLDRLEADDTSAELWRAIVAKLHVICKEPDSHEARERQVRSSGGETFWLVTIRIPSEKDDWGIFWAPNGNEAVFTYIGPWPPLR